MLYRNNMPRQCATCARAVRLNNTDMICKKYGVVYVDYGCRRYVYDPLKRVPSRMPPVPSGKTYTLK
jgi:hypothetical protein